MYRHKFPNLELLHYKAKEVLLRMNIEKYKDIELVAEVFPQTWASTALGFGGVGGQAMTTAYTTVFIDWLKGVAIIFFDSRLAYLVEDWNNKFLEDLKKRELLSVERAMVEY